MINLNLIGIDISEVSIKVLQLDTSGKIIAYKSMKLPSGVVERGNIVDKEAFSKALSSLLDTISTSVLQRGDNFFHAVLCIPESKLFSHYCLLPDSVKAANEKEYVKDEAQKIIPFKIENLYWNYHVVEERGVRNATFVGVAKSDLDNYVEAFMNAHVQPTFVGGELFALGRALLPEPPLEKDYLIVDIGAHSTTIGAFAVDVVPNMSILVPQGGEYFTEYIAEKLHLSKEDAEEQKCHFGVDITNEGTQVPVILRECLSPIVEKIKTARNFFENKTGSQIQQVIIAGGSSLLPGLDRYLSEHLEVGVSVADPLQKIRNKEQLNDDTPEVLLANVVGLALSENYADFSHFNLLNQYQEEKRRLTQNNLATQDIYSFTDLYFVVRGLTKKAFKYFQNLLSVFGLSRIQKPARAKLLSTLIFLGIAIMFLYWVVVTYM